MNLVYKAYRREVDYKLQPVKKKTQRAEGQRHTSAIILFARGSTDNVVATSDPLLAGMHMANIM